MRERMVLPFALQLEECFFPYLNLPISKAFAFFGIIHYIFKNNTVRVLFKNNFSRYIKWLEI